MFNLSPFAIVTISIALSLLPAAVWAFIFLYKSGEKRHVLFKTFALGGLMVVPMFFYRQFWSAFPQIDLVQTLKPLENREIVFGLFGGDPISLPLSLLILFITIGAAEEFFKHLVAKNTDRKEFNSVTDAMEFSIVAALGFAFAENTFYFIEIYQNLGTEMLMKVFIFRAIFSTFAHVLFSAIYGYHFGLAMFAKPIYQEMSYKNFFKKIIFGIHRILHFRASAIFEKEQRFIGLFFAATLHAIFNILLEVKATEFLIPFLIFGFFHVLILLKEHENNVEYTP